MKRSDLMWFAAGSAAKRRRWMGAALCVACLAAAAAASVAIGSGPGTLRWQTCFGGKLTSGFLFNDSHCPTNVRGITGPVGVVVSPDGRSVYVADPAGDDIVHFQRGHSGALHWKNCIAAPNGYAAGAAGCSQKARGLRFTSSLAISPDGRSLYATSFEDSAVVHFQRDPATGNLTRVGCVAGVIHNPEHCAKEARGMFWAETVSVSPDGRSVYVIAHLGDKGDNIVVFKRAHNGSLTRQECIVNSQYANPSGCSGSGKGFESFDPVVVSPDGNDAYATFPALAHFKRGRSGELTYLGCVRGVSDPSTHCAKKAAGLHGAEGIAISPDGGSLYAAGADDNALVRFKRSSNGSLTDEGCVGDRGNNPAGCAKTARGLLHPIATEVSADGASVYVLTRGGGSGTTEGIVVFKRSSGGSLTFQSCVGPRSHNAENCPQTARGFSVPGAMALSPDGTSLYATNQAPNGSAPGLGLGLGPALVGFTRTP